LIPGSFHEAESQGGLNPLAACHRASASFLTFSVFNTGNTGRSSRHEPMVAMILSNQNYAAYASDNFRGAQNNLFAVTFDWTNHGGLPSSMSSYPRGRTNY